MDEEKEEEERPEGNPEPAEPRRRRHARGTGPPSLTAPIARLLGRLTEDDLVIRTVAAAVVIAVGMALTSVTFSITQNAMGLLRGQDPFLRAYPVSSTSTSTTSSYLFPPSAPLLSFVPSSVTMAPTTVALAPQPSYYAPSAAPLPVAVANSTMTKVLATVLSLAGLAATIPVLLAWLALIRLSGHAARIFAETILVWPIRREDDLQADDRTGIVVQFLKWFRALAFSYLAILVVGVVERGVLTTLTVSLTGTPPFSSSPHVTPPPQLLH